MLTEEVMSNKSCAIVLVTAAILDYLIGDPWGWIHPVQAIGWTISRCSQTLLNLTKNSPTFYAQRGAGMLLAIGIIFGSAILGRWAIVLSQQLHPFFGAIAASIILASCFAGRSLRNAAVDVLQPLEAGNLVEARSRLTRYVGRDTKDLTEAEILRAVLETVSENATDGVMAPLFYAIVGGLFPAIGCAPLALAYKAASTLDSMVGYKEEPFTHLGWFSAKLEDVLTWIPCRLTVLTLGLTRGQLRRVWSICQRDATQDPSPNSGWSECTYAVILGVQLGGVNSYRGVVKHKPLLGNPDRPITSLVIHQALTLTRIGFTIWLAIGVCICATIAARIS